jgi:hypothetical protein
METMTISTLDCVAVLVAALCSFLLGGLWYSGAIFGRIWQREMGDSREMGQGHPIKVFGLSFLFALVAAGSFYLLLGSNPGLERALTYGLLAGAGLVATSFGINYQFANRSAVVWFIDAGYHLSQFVIYGLIYAFWP